MELTLGNCCEITGMGRKEEIHISQRDDRQRHLIIIEFEFLRSDGGLLILLPFVINRNDSNDARRFYLIVDCSC